jgi:HPr kinase/phosphorylase
MKRDTVTVERFYSEKGGSLGLELVTGQGGLKRIIREPTVNRPGLTLAGFTRYFAMKRVQVIGNAEHSFLHSLSPVHRKRRYANLLAYKIPCVVFCRGLRPDRVLLDVADRLHVPVFTCPLITMKFINLATLALEAMFAPHATEMGSMVDIHGIGVIVRGESGIGKSECVLALIERGYSLVSDDITKLVLLDGREVVGSSAEVTRDHMEVRGIGIINVAAMFGVKSIRLEKRVDLIVTLQAWKDVQDIDRLGVENEYIKLLGIKIPHIIIPVSPGRDLARLTEVAALQTKLKQYGHNAARELDRRLLDQMAKASAPA